MKILVVNSCGKAKQAAFPTQAQLQDLQTRDQIRQYVQKHQDKAIAARYLYTGQQASKISKAIKILRDTGHEVEYFIISAGLGLLTENQLVPSYEVTFSGLGKSAILQRSKMLQINSSLEKEIAGKYYDLIYLALGKDYLLPLALENFRHIASLVVHFDRSDEFLTEPFFQVNDSEIIGKDGNIAEFTSPIGNLVQSKGSILLNYAQFIQDQGTIEFDEWWINVLNSLQSPLKNH